MQTTTVKQFFQQLKIIHAALILGQLIFATLVFLMLEAPLDHDEISGWETMAPWVVGAVAVICYALSRFAVQRKVANVKHRESISEKLQGYRESMILRWAFLEIPSFFGIIGAFMTNESIYLLFPVAFLLIFFMEYPSQNKAIVMLALDAQDRATVEDPLAQITATK